MGDITKLVNVARSVDTPLGVASLALLVLYAIYKLLIEKRIFPQVTPSAAANLIGRMIHWLGVLALVALVLVLARPFVLNGKTDNGELNQRKNAMTAAYSQ